MDKDSILSHPLLFDQNLSHRLIGKIQPNFPKAVQVRELGLENATDFEIWVYARDKGYSIVTFDADFYDFSQFYGVPPKIIWLRFGNTSTTKLAEVLCEHLNTLAEFIDDPYAACLQITK